MHKVKYIYDYPGQREIAKDLLIDDIIRISEKLGYSVKYIQAWCRGTRKNSQIETLARQYAKINQRTILRKEKVSIYFSLKIELWKQNLLPDLGSLRTEPSTEVTK